MEENKIKVTRLPYINVWVVSHYPDFTFNSTCSTTSNEGINDIKYYIQRVANKKGWKYEKMLGWLKSIKEHYPIATLSIILREVALKLDEKYSDHIRNSEKLYGISTLNGQIFEINKKHVKNYKNFAAFRTKEDAEIAHHVVEGLLKDMYEE